MKYDSLLKQANEVINNEDYFISLLSNASAFLNQVIPNLNWIGFYLLKDDQLIVGPFNGKVACNKIPLGKGVCGEAVLNNKIMVIKDVHQHANHIACDANSNSETVIPIIVNNKMLGCLDCDSSIVNRFDEELVSFLISFVKLLSKRLESIKLDY